VSIEMLRKDLHRAIVTDIMRVRRARGLDIPSFADTSSNTSTQIACAMLKRLSSESMSCERMDGQTAGRLFEASIVDFLRKAFGLLEHLRPGSWRYACNEPISTYAQYNHLAILEKLVKEFDTLASSLGVDYIVRPDIVIGRYPVPDEEINAHGDVVSGDGRSARLTPLRARDEEQPLILHASISCKWTLRSDRAQNARTEAVNLIRNRKGTLPHVVAVTIEPMPTRIASLALGTGDLDCVYHVALYELEDAIREIGNADQLEMLDTIVQGKRLRDISDLPFDLAT
jgi:hypothetical protein